jgi:magnesium-transporting ATPase (P-type)
MGVRLLLCCAGDIVVIKSGDKVPADLRLLQAANLQVRAVWRTC